MSVLSRPYAERDGSELVEYDGFAVEFREKSHRYWLIRDDARTPAISVTSALRVLDKPALLRWAEKAGAEGALTLERQGELRDVPVEQAIEIVRVNGLGAAAKRDAGADRGTAVHEALRVYCETGTVPTLADFPAEVRGYVQAACGWLLEAAPEPMASEIIIGSPEHGYAGRVDLISGSTLIDFKTNPGGRVYDEAHLQAAAYLGALPECGYDGVRHAMIVALGEEGEFEAVDCMAEHRDFLSVLDTSRRMARIRNARQARERAAK